MTREEQEVVAGSEVIYVDGDRMNPRYPGR